MCLGWPIVRQNGTQHEMVERRITTGAEWGMLYVLPIIDILYTNHRPTWSLWSLCAMYTCMQLTYCTLLYCYVLVERRDIHCCTLWNYNWQKWNSKIWMVENVGFKKKVKLYFKTTIFVILWNFRQFCENLYFINSWISVPKNHFVHYGSNTHGTLFVSTYQF